MERKSPYLNIKEILNVFIKKELNAYVRFRHEARSKRQYHAMLLMLTDRKLKDIAKEAGVSYGTIRNWNSEEDFKREVFAIGEEFVTYFEDQVKSLIESNVKSMHTVTPKKGPFPDIKMTIVRRLFESAFRAGIIRKRTNSEEERIKLEGKVSSIRTALLSEAMKFLKEPFTNDETRKDALLTLSYIMALE